MPIYVQQCVSCKHRFEDYRTISKYGVDPLCPQCGSKTERTVTIAAVNKDWDKPQISQAMACSPEDAPARERATGVKHTKTGEPIFHNKQERLGFMRKTGYHDRAAYFGRG